ncbi:hypothetical protein BCR37DRAFT_257024 [Protomyces lactucae-debilis]|uniref:RRM domain-containing protein n=1 Tax=Protomyces lactucae-debilis TaxID=2754530 RepID=A0A1Y2FM69_PROLT|nr:uncharacterized protein BCR37DRAFT_257024 [Protomyces lactucae-debilis]ORY85019.1 hypothetical protein BCR37DRAFT_257024 [Protomyces lactucae-debilis]
MASVAAYSQVIFDITPAKSSTSSNGVDVPTPPATLSTSSKSTGSSGSMQHSRLSSYVKDKPDLTPINAVPSLTPSNSLGMDEFYGSVPKGSLGVISSSVPTNFSTSAGGTVWSPTSPRFASVGGDLAKSPPTGFSMLPPPTAKEDDAWSRSTTATRFAGLSLSGGPPDLARGTADRNGAQGGMSPILSHGFPSIDKSLGSPHLNGNAPPFAGTYQHAGIGFNPASAKQHAGMTNNAYAAMNPTATGFVVGNRLGPAFINTNPADQNPPCNTLYVGNLPLATTEEELKSLFSRQQGYRRLCYRTKSNGPMCFVEFEDVHYAIQALKLLQGVILSSSIKGGIRLSFSKNPLGVRKMDAGQGFVPQQQSQQQQHHHHHHSHTLQQHQQHGQSGALMGQHAHMGAPGHLLNNGYAPLAPPGLASSNGHTTSHASQQPPIGVFGHGMPPAQHQAQSSQAPVWR